MVHHFIRALGSRRREPPPRHWWQLGSKAEIARELAYRLYTLCERKKRATEALVLQRPSAKLARDRTARAQERHQPKPSTTLSPNPSETMAITNHQRVGKTLDLLSVGWRLFIHRDLKHTAVGRIREASRFLSPDAVVTNKPAAMGCHRTARRSCGIVERGFPQDARPRRAHPRLRAARRPQPLGAPETFSSDDAIARSTRWPAPDRGVRAAGRRGPRR